jgi:hypothetical protein
MPMNYASLTVQIQQYANRTDDDFNNQIPNFIAQAINRIYYEARDIGFEVTRSSALVPDNGDQTILFTTNWKETLSFTLLDVRLNPIAQILLPRTYEFCLDYWPNLDQTAPPVFYSVRSYNNNNLVFYLSPIPDLNYGYEINYLGIPLLDATHTTNFLTERYPALLLYACMVETIPFLKNDERIPVYESLYNRALQDVNRTAKERYTDRISKRDKD